MPHITGLPSTHPLPCACTLRSFRRQRLSNFAASSLPARGCGTKHNPFRVYSDITSAKLRTRSRQLFAIDSDKSGFETFQSGSAGRQVLDWVNDSVKWVVTLAAAFVLLRYHNVWVNWCLVGSIVAALTCKVPITRSFTHVCALAIKL